MKYLELVKKLAKCFEMFDISQVPREKNVEADALAYLASFFRIPEGVKIPIVSVKN